MESTVIVALPAENDSTRKVSSETEPHITLLYLGADADNEAIVGEIASFLEHASITSMNRFVLDVDRRGTLGDKEADVLFFKDSDEHDMGRLKEFRNFLLGNETIRTAYDSVEQFPNFIPHLTLGYPETPANDEDNHIGPFVYFDRIAFWSGNYEGPTYQLKDYEDKVPVMQHTSETFLSTMGIAEPLTPESFLEQLGVDYRDVSERFLAQAGIKGMRWGFRRTQAQLASGAPATAGKPSGAATKSDTVVSLNSQTGKASVTGSNKKDVNRVAADVAKNPEAYGLRRTAKVPGASSEAARAAYLKDKAAKGGVKALSNAELKELNDRINLEKSYNQYRAANPTKKQLAKKVALDIVKDAGTAYLLSQTPKTNGAKFLAALGFGRRPDNTNNSNNSNNNSNNNRSNNNNNRSSNNSNRTNPNPPRPTSTPPPRSRTQSPAPTSRRPPPPPPVRRARPNDPVFNVTTV